jgi:hypothetical protein
MANVVNEFYSISEPNCKAIDNYQLEHLGEMRVNNIGMVHRKHGENVRTDIALPERIVARHYDDFFVYLLYRFDPPYEAKKMLDYHYHYYIEKGGYRQKFIEHIELVILPRITNPHKPVVEKWINDAKKFKPMIIEYSELAEVEKQAINNLFVDPQPGFATASYLHFYKSEIESCFPTNPEFHTKRAIQFLETNDFAELFDYSGRYALTDEGRKLMKFGTLEKYYEKTGQQHLLTGKQQPLQSHPSIIGDGNVINFAGGNIHQSGISISISKDQFQQLKELGVNDEKINELKEIAGNSRGNKERFLSKAMKWVGDVTTQLVVEGLTKNIPLIIDVIQNIANNPYHIQ